MNKFNTKIIILFLISTIDAVLTVYLVTKGWSEIGPIWYLITEATNITIAAIIKILVTFGILVYIVKTRKFEKYLSLAIIVYCVIYGSSLVIGSLLTG